MSLNSFGTRTALTVGSETLDTYSLPALARAGVADLDALPFSLKILLENLLRREDNAFVRPADIEALARWRPGRRRAKCRSCPRACSCRISPACPASSIWRRCATASCASAEIPIA
jgi:aconitase A